MGLARRKTRQGPPQPTSLPTITSTEQVGHLRLSIPQAQEWGEGTHLGTPRRWAVVVLAPWPWPGPGRMAQGLSGGWQVHAR